MALAKALAKASHAHTNRLTQPLFRIGTMKRIEGRTALVDLARARLLHRLLQLIFSQASERMSGSRSSSGDLGRPPPPKAFSPGQLMALQGRI